MWRTTLAPPTGKSITHDPAYLVRRSAKNTKKAVAESFAKSTAFKKYQMDYRVWIVWSEHMGCYETWEKSKKHEPLGECF